MIILRAYILKKIVSLYCSRCDLVRNLEIEQKTWTFEKKVNKRIYIKKFA